MVNGWAYRQGRRKWDVNSLCLDMLSVVIARVYALFIHRYVNGGVAIRQLSGRRPDMARDGGGQGYGQAVMTVSIVWASTYVTPQAAGRQSILKRIYTYFFTRKIIVTHLRYRLNVFD